MRRLVLATLLLAFGAPAHAQTQDRPVVVELFTSQGCSSCPPADALLRELAGRPDVLALAFHVTYWNGLGWRDPYSLDAATERQRAYARRFALDSIYTPQMVIDGVAEMVGSDRDAVRAALAAARPRPVVPVTLTRDGANVSVTLGAGMGEGHVLLVGFDSGHNTEVKRGENAGRRLSEANIVRTYTVLGVWQGRPLTLSAPLPGAERAAVIVQAPGGAMLGVAVLPRPAEGVSG